LYGLDHAQTLAIVLPAMLRVRRAAKRKPATSRWRWRATCSNAPSDAPFRASAGGARNQQLYNMSISRRTTIGRAMLHSRLR
jgi:hypothetical protein